MSVNSYTCIACKSKQALTAHTETSTKSSTHTLHIPTGNTTVAFKNIPANGDQDIFQWQHINLSSLCSEVMLKLNALQVKMASVNFS